MHEKEINRGSFLWMALLIVFCWTAPLSVALSATEEKRSNEIYLTKKEAFALAFPGADQIKKSRQNVRDLEEVSTPFAGIIGIESAGDQYIYAIPRLT